MTWNWEHTGAWQDAKMPTMERLSVPFYGTWTIPIDLTDALEVLGKIRSGQILWQAKIAENCALEAIYSLDGGLKYRSLGVSKTENGQSQPANDLNNDMDLRIGFVLRAELLDLIPEETIEISEAILVLSNKPMVQTVIDDYYADRVLIWSKDRVLQAVLPGAVAKYSRRKNEATTISISVPNEAIAKDISTGHSLYDFFSPAKEDKLQKYAEIAAYVQVYSNGKLKATGRISGRTFGREVTIQAYTEEILLERYLTPAQYGMVWEGWDLAAVARNLIWGWHSLRVTDKNQWLERLVDSSNVDLDTEPGRILLAKTASGAYRTNGYITLRFRRDEVPDFVEWDRIRWSADSEDPVSTSISYKRDNENWQGPFDGGLPEEVGWAIAGDAEEVLVRIDLKTEDTETQDSEGKPVGVTPYVFALELIARTMGEIAEGDLPEYAGVTVSGLKADYDTAFTVLADAAKQCGWEFNIWNNKLNLAAELGKDRRKEMIFRTGSNMEVNTLKSSDEELVNHLVAVGIGNGIDRPQITLWDAESQAKYGIYPKKVEFDATSYDALSIQAQGYLDEHKDPAIYFTIDAFFERGKEPEISIGDTVTAIDPDTGTVLSTRIAEESGEITREGVRFQYALGRARLTLDGVINDRQPLAKTDKPDRPVSVFAWRANTGLIISCATPKGDWAYTEYHVSVMSGFIPSSSTLKRRGRVNSMTIVWPGMGQGRHYVKLVHVDSLGRRSDASEEVSIAPLNT